MDNPQDQSAIGKLSCLGAAGHQPVPEKFQDFVARCDRRLTRLVDQVSGHHTMRGRDIALEEWRKIGIRRAVLIGPH